MGFLVREPGDIKSKSERIRLFSKRPSEVRTGCSLVVVVSIVWDVHVVDVTTYVGFEL